jgi:predicted permease
METLFQDLRYGIRAMFKDPGFTAVAVIALALGIGATTSIFSVVDAVLLRPLPYKSPEQLVMLWHNYPELNLPDATISVPSYYEYRDMPNSFEQVATQTGWSVNLTGTGEPERIRGARVSANLFPTLGVEPARGRGFLDEEDQPGRNRVVVMSHGLWQRRFGGDPNILGQTITLNGNSYTVVGVMPAGFVFRQDFELWTPIAFTNEDKAAENHGSEFLEVVARMKPGVTLDQARAEMDSIANQLRPQFYQDSSWGIVVNSLREQIVGNIKPALMVLLKAVACVLLIACANVANLLLARASARQKEVAIRTALGASRARLVRQMLTESVLLSAVGGALGLLLAYLGVKFLMLGAVQAIFGINTNWMRIGINGPVLGFTMAVSLLTGITFGIVPALQASKPDLNESLKEGGRGGSEGGRRNRLRSILVVFEVATALVLLIGAGLLIRSFLRILDVNPGFNPRNVISIAMSLPRSKYAENHQVAAFYEQALQQVKAIPGAQHAAFGTNLPMSGDNSSASYAIEGRPAGPGESSPHGDPRMITPDYFITMGVPLLKGRYFTEQDSKDSVPVTIIDDVLAERYFPDENPIGKRIAAFFEGSPDKPRWREIVGVVGHVKHYGLDGKTKEQYYFPQTQSPTRFMYLLVRSENEPTSLVPAIREAIRAVDKDQPIFRVTTMEEIVSNSLAQRRLSMFLLVVFAAVALLLAAVGIYGVMSYAVTQRTREIGIRMALGAQTGDVLKMVVRQGMIVTFAGVGVGVVVAFLATQVMSSLLFGVSAHDPVTFAAIPAILAGVALGASFVPARRATKVDPMIALRHE